MIQTGQTYNVIVSSWTEIWGKVAQYLPQLIGAIILLIIGMVIAKVIEKTVVQVLKLARFDVLSEKTGIATILTKGEIRQTLSELLGLIIYWLLILIAVIISLNAVGITAAGFLDKVGEYASNVVLSIFVLILGLFFAGLTGSIVRTSAANIGIAMAKNLGQIAQVAIIVITALTILPMLGVRTLVIDTIVVVFLSAIGLALALAFGIGAKDAAGKITSDFIDKWKKK
ncbi:MAG: hypothetical protein V1933_05820 [Candidatus Omnitrophota bacterium]